MKIKHYDNARLYKLFKEVEIPVMFVSAKMELDGICIDTEYSERLSKKYHKKLDKVNEEISTELEKLKPTIDAWRLSKDANIHPPSKSASGVGKSKNEQLADPPEVTSPTQLAILLYDVLKIKPPDPKNERGTGTEILEQMEAPICKSILQQRTILKMLDAFIDTLPTLLSPKDHRLHSHFNQLGTDTGRFSCTDPNLQQIPSKNKEIRMMFAASTKDHIVEEENNCYIIPYTDEVEVESNKWISVKDLKIGDKIFNSENNYDTIKNITLENNNYRIEI